MSKLIWLLCLSFAVVGQAQTPLHLQTPPSDTGPVDKQRIIDFSSVHAYYRSTLKFEYGVLHETGKVELCVTDDNGETSEERFADVIRKWERASLALADGREFDKTELVRSEPLDNHARVCATITLKNFVAPPRRVDLLNPPDEILFDTPNAFLRTQYRQEYEDLHKTGQVRFCLTYLYEQSGGDRISNAQSRWKRVALALADGDSMENGEPEIKATTRPVSVCGLITLTKEAAVPLEKQLRESEAVSK